MTGLPASVLSLRGGVVEHDGRPVLRGVDLRVTAGEVVAVLGANGSGKTTLVRAVLGLTPLSAGSVELFGEPAARFTDWPRIGWVPQRVGATSGVPATVREVVASGRLPRMRRLRRPSAVDRAAVDDAVSVVGLADRASDSVATLSGGQQQRVLIARALASGPDLLVLDEPTSGVDAENQVALARALGELVGRGVAVVLVAHELGPMAPLVDRAVVLRDGLVVHDGPVPTEHDLHAHDPEHAHPPHDEPHGRSGRPVTAAPNPWG